jgi:hypothetical protein
VPHPFLSDEWVEEARQIRDEYRDRATPAATMPSIRINHVITDVPFGDGKVKAHTDTSSGTVETDVGHLANADTTVTLPYSTAKAIIIDGNIQVAMQDFMAGKIRVEGDITKLMALQQVTQAADPVVGEINARIRSITE